MQIHHERKATDTETDQGEKEDLKRPGTYDLGPRQGTFDIPSQLDNQKGNLERNFISIL